MHLFFDVASCELFADDGTVVMTDIFFPNGDFSKFEFVGEGLLSGDVWEF
jgi:fructan beta-fructosidase